MCALSDTNPPANQLPSQSSSTSSSGDPPLGWRSRLLAKLESFFPPVDAPQLQGEHAEYEYENASGSFTKALAEIGSLEGKRVLDFGCGWGGETAWLAQHAQLVVGCDVDADALKDADLFRQKKKLSNLSFAHIKHDKLPIEDNTFDYVLSTNVFEHVFSPLAMLQEILRVLKPGGRFVSQFGPLFHGPQGHQLPWVTQVPYAHFLFGHDAILALRNRKCDPIDSICWEDTAQLNRITFSGFAKAVEASGFQIHRLKRIAVKKLWPLAVLPVIGNLLTFGVDCHLIKPQVKDDQTATPTASDDPITDDSK